MKRLAFALGLALAPAVASAETWMVIEGASLVVTGGALGHKDPQSTAIYARLSVDPVKHAMEKAQAAIFGLAQEGARLDAASGK